MEKEPVASNGGAQELTTRQEIVLEVEGLRAHVSVLAELASLP